MVTRRSGISTSTFSTPPSRPSERRIESAQPSQWISGQRALHTEAICQSPYMDFSCSIVPLVDMHRAIRTANERHKGAFVGILSGFLLINIHSQSRLLIRMGKAALHLADAGDDFIHRVWKACPLLNAEVRDDRLQGD